MHHATSQKRIFIFIIILVTGLTLSLLCYTIFNTKAVKAAVANWNAGYIISDYVFTNKSSMNTSSIQAFLNSKVPDCDTYGEETSEFGGGTRRQWAEARGYNPPYTCLRDFSENGKSAAQIIYEAAQRYSINPQVLLVLLQKEQGLVQDEWPINIQYRSATGYGCPDTAACDSEYYGFTNQVRWAATMFRAIMNDSPSWYTPYELGANYIRYSPDASCGGSNVNIQNRATQALYNYTPYQPNQAALDAGWGTAPCGAYGNRNFYLYFMIWFGGTRTAFTPMETPRWMRTRAALYKKDPSTGSNAGASIAPGTQIYFADKITINGTTYLRTLYDRNHSIFRGIPLSGLEDIPFEPLESPQYLMLTKDAHKFEPRSQKMVKSLNFRSGLVLKFTSKITVNGTPFYQTEYDDAHGGTVAFYASSLEEPDFTAFEAPRYMVTTSNTQKYDPIQETLSATVISTGTQLRFASKMLVNNLWYYRTEYDTDNNSFLTIPSSAVSDIPYQPIDSTWMRLNASSTKIVPSTGSSAGAALENGARLFVTRLITVNGITYYQTAYDASRNLNRAIVSSNLTEEPYETIAKETRELSSVARKQITETLEHDGAELPVNTKLTLSSKIQLSGTWYYRTEYDTIHNIDRVISEEFLSTS